MNHHVNWTLSVPCFGTRRSGWRSGIKDWETSFYFISITFVRHSRDSLIDFELLASNASSVTFQAFGTELKHKYLIACTVQVSWECNIRRIQFTQILCEVQGQYEILWSLTSRDHCRPYLSQLCHLSLETISAAVGSSFSPKQKISNWEQNIPLCYSGRNLRGHMGQKQMSFSISPHELTLEAPPPTVVFHDLTRTEVRRDECRYNVVIPAFVKHAHQTPEYICSFQVNFSEWYGNLKLWIVNCTNMSSGTWS